MFEIDFKVWQIVLYILIWIIEMYFFGVQRFILKICRFSNVDYRTLGRKLLPNWYSINMIVQLCKYGFLIYLITYDQLIFAVILFISGFILSLIIPFPYRSLYSSVTWKKALQVNSDSPQDGARLIECLTKWDIERGG